MKHLDFGLAGFGTRGSEVQILSPRPSLESINYNKSPGADEAISLKPSCQVKLSKQLIR